MNNNVPSDANGRRIICDGEYATVHYTGNVPPTPGLWLGVEWDNPLRGKHSGTHEGTKYFTCSHPTGGSFIRLKKANFGVDFLTALRKRYGLKTEQNEELVIGKKTVELVGFESIQEEQSKLNKLRDVSLREYAVSNAGEKGQICHSCPNIITADLSKNLFSSWESVANITFQLEKLMCLDLSENKLYLPSNPSSLAGAFCSLKVLSLNRMGLKWNEILQCASMWPALEELRLVSNDISVLERPVDNLQNLTILDISNNRIVDGNQLHAIACLPRLKQIIVTNNRISSLSFPDVDFGHKTTMFLSLTSLAVDGNNISEILPNERRGAELDYRKMFGNDWLKAGGSQNEELNKPNRDFLQDHPRYSALIEKYGAPDEGELKQQQPFALKNQLLTLTIQCPDKPDKKTIQKKLPDSMTVQKVKGLLYRLLKVPGSDLKLSYKSSKMEGKEIDLENDLKPLQFYSVENGDCLLVRW
eukprot:XP_012818410.1 PREDICTED: tubulin-specific chaperone E isoform X1 [Xenopus tropicalis]